MGRAAGIFAAGRVRTWLMAGAALPLALIACDGAATNADTVTEAAGSVQSAPGVPPRPGTNALPQAADSYFSKARSVLAERLAEQPRTGRAKNIILFIGDGMGVSTVTAGRIFAGQEQGGDGVSHDLTFDTLPYAALAKTYTHDAQVADSAGTATAMMTGVKARNGVINVDQTVARGDCAGSADGSVPNLAELAEDAGKAVGVVSTARITHATPATVYAHSADRSWENDQAVPEDWDPDTCPDIARQLIEFPYGDGIEVALGGGRANFLPSDMADPEEPEIMGRRGDGRDLTRDWLDRYGNSGAYVWNAEQFAAIDPAETKHLLGLFEPSHLEFEADRPDDRAGEPSLADLTVKAIDILEQDTDGYFLMVEAGRIDHAHHGGNAFRALKDTVAFDEAVKAALDKIDLDETLIIVTADHSHVFTIAGYPARGTPILGLAADVTGTPQRARDGRPYTTLGYQNGPGAVVGSRPDPSESDPLAPDYRQQALIPLGSETHAGEDVAIYAAGPWAHLFRGTVEQNFIFHVMGYASGLARPEEASGN